MYVFITTICMLPVHCTLGVYNIKNINMQYSKKDVVLSFIIKPVSSLPFNSTNIRLSLFNCFTFFCFFFICFFHRDTRFCQSILFIMYLPCVPNYKFCIPLFSPDGPIDSVMVNGSFHRTYSKRKGRE